MFDDPKLMSHGNRNFDDTKSLIISKYLMIHVKFHISNCTLMIANFLMIQDSFLTPHLNPRSVSTRSNIEVRSPINSKSVGGWKNYKEMLKPAIEILTQTDRYRDITY